MSDIKQKFGANGQTITITIASLANNAARESTVIDNSSNLYEDALVAFKIRSASSSTSSSGYVEVWAYATVNNGTDYSDGATGSDAAFTPTAAPNLAFVGTINVVANSTTYKSATFSIARAFGGVLPEKWGIVLVNRTGNALDSTAGNHSAFYQGKLSQV